ARRYVKLMSDRKRSILLMKSIQEIKSEFDHTPENERARLFALYETDARKGVQAVLTRYRKQEQKLQEERARMYRMFAFEREYCGRGAVCGIDEAGRGPLAGPVVA